MKDVPGADSVDIIVNGGSGVRAGEAGDERSEYVLTGGGPQVLRQAFDVAVHMVDQNARTVRLPGGVSPCIRHDLKDMVYVVLLRGRMPTADIRRGLPEQEAIFGQTVRTEGRRVRGEVWAIGRRPGNPSSCRDDGQRCADSGTTVSDTIGDLNQVQAKDCRGDLRSWEWVDWGKAADQNRR
jgi:hypothetical protein